MNLNVVRLIDSYSFNLGEFAGDLDHGMCQIADGTLGNGDFEILNLNLKAEKLKPITKEQFNAAIAALDAGCNLVAMYV